MAREKYELSQITSNLANSNMWIHWVDNNGEEHHTLRSLAAIIPETAKILKDET